jgi:hypothetical protein
MKRKMANQRNREDQPYEGERSTEQSRDTGNINSRTNNVEASTSGKDELNVENASNAGIGDAAVNDRKLTNFTQNHSGDA